MFDSIQQVDCGTIAIIANQIYICEKDKEGGISSLKKGLHYFKKKNGEILIIVSADADTNVYLDEKEIKFLETIGIFPQELTCW